MQAPLVSGGRYDCTARTAPRLVPLLCLGIALAACQDQARTYSRSFPMFGTMAEVRILGDDAQLASQALDQIETLYIGFDRDWRAFGGGELGRVNAALRAGHSAPLSAELARLVQRSLQMHELSDGLFDPRIGPLVALWGFDDIMRERPQRAPEQAVIAALREQALHEASLHLDGERLSSDAPVALDLNGIAEGAALRAGAELLAGLGIEHALIDTGGDLIALGRHGNRPWRAGIRNPTGPGLIATVDLEPGESIASSGSYERRFGPAGEHHHILDPRTGQPSRGSAGTTVIARDPELADAAATTLMVAGPERFFDLAARMGVTLALLVTADGARLVTPAMAKRLQPAGAVPVPHASAATLEGGRARRQ